MRTAVRAEDVLSDRGLRFPPGYWDLTVVFWGRTQSSAGKYVPDPHRPARPDDVLVCSTGVIGVPLDMPALLSGAGRAAGALAPTPEAGHDAARAIMTTGSSRGTGNETNYVMQKFARAVLNTNNVDCCARV